VSYYLNTVAATVTLGASHTTHFITDCPKRKKIDSYNKYDYTYWNDYNKGDNNKKNHFGDNRKKF
jgi:hypothetical protein